MKEKARRQSYEIFCLISNAEHNARAYVEVNYVLKALDEN